MPTALIVGASRGLGHAMAAEFFDRGWNVIGTVRDATARTLLHDLAERSDGRVTVEHLDINEPTQLAPLHERLAPRELDILFVNAGTTNNEQTPIGAVPTADFVEVMITNALSPMRVIETLEDLVSPSGLIGAMSSGQGSITNNTTGSREVYRGSKAALNMFMRSFSVRQSETQRAFVLMAPGWVRTALGDQVRNSPLKKASRAWWTFCCRGEGSPVFSI
jgi:NAD(P)-dependent dehydrogenase (short-subunit alcohol dehydrogenase family)